MRIFLICLALTTVIWARPAQSPRALATFDIPENLQQAGGSRWGQPPGLVIEMREEYSTSSDLKELRRSLCPPNGHAKDQEDSVEIDGNEATVISRTEGIYYSKHLLLHKGNYHLAWSLWSAQNPKEEVDAVFDRLRSSIRLSTLLKPGGEGEGSSKEVTDPSGQLQIDLPSSYASADGRKYTNGEMMVILTPLKEGGVATVKEFALRYTPAGYSAYLRRPEVDIGPHKGGLILATSTDGNLESQLVMLANDKNAVVLTFIAPVRSRGALTVFREQVTGKARWTH